MIGQRRVIDSCVLRSEELRQFLEQQVANLAVLPDFVWFELYKQKSASAVRDVLSVIGHFPEQIIILKSGSEIANIDPRVSCMTEAMQRADMALGIKEMVKAMTGPDQDLQCVRAQLERLWSGYTELIPDLMEGAADIVASLPEMAEQMFTSHEIRVIRTKGHFTAEMFANIFGATDQIWETLSFNSKYSPLHLEMRHKTNAYLYRYSLALIIYLIFWIRNGSPAQKRLEKVNNDLIDLSFSVYVIYATYYDGLMTADRNASWIHHELSRGLKLLGVDVPMLRSAST